MIERVTREDVARRAGVSVATVSYVMNDGPRPVAPETRARVLKAIEELGYQPNHVARSLKTRKTFTIGLIVSDILNYFHNGVARSIEEAARAAGYAVILCNSDEDPAQELFYLRMLQSKDVDGIIFVPTGGNIEYLQNLLRQGYKLVQLDRALPELWTDSCVLNNEQGAYEAVRHLIEMGHRRIGLISPPFVRTPGEGRRKGYLRALREAGLHADPELIYESDFKADTSVTATYRLLDLADPPTAIFAGTNRLALGVISALRHRNLSIPDDIALCVFDDLDYYSLLRPQITAVGYSLQELGQRVFELLLQQISETRAERVLRHEIVPCELRIRESTRNVRR